MLKNWMWIGLFAAFNAFGEAGPANLLEFLSDYSEAIIHVVPPDEQAEGAEVRIDFWKRMDSAERDTEAVEYLRHRGLLEGFEGGGTSFLRMLSDQEMSEVLHFKMEVSDPSLMEALETRFFRFALVRMVEVDRDGNVDREPLGLDAGAAASAQELRTRVIAYLDREPTSDMAPVAE